MPAAVPSFNPGILLLGSVTTTETQEGQGTYSRSELVTRMASNPGAWAARSLEFSQEQE
jgi:hypothetical protein